MNANVKHCGSKKEGTFYCLPVEDMPFKGEYFMEKANK
jgi:hypothetical protein